MQADSLTYKTLKNVSYSFAGYAFPIVFSIFITPIIVFKLGLADYGFFIFLNTISSIMGLLDLGVSTALVKYVAEYYEIKDFAGLKKLISSANLLFFIIASLGFLVFLLIGFLAKNFGLLGKELNYGFLYFFIGGLVFFVNIASSVYYALPTALLRLDIGAKIGITKLVMQSLLMLLAVILGGGLFGALSVVLFNDLFFAFVYRHYVKKIMPEIHFSLAFDKIELKRCYRFGLVYFVANLSNSLLYQLDRLLIPFYLNPTQLTYYSLPGNVTTKIQGLNNNLATVLFPMSSALSVANQKSKLAELYLRAFRLLTIMGAALTTVVITFSYQILKYWLSEDFAKSSSQVLIILALTYFLLAIAGPLNNFLLGLGKVKILAWFSFLMMLINVVALLIFLPKYGITGAAWSYLVAVLPIYALFYYTEKNILGFSRQRYWEYLKLYLKIFCCFGLAFLLGKLLLIKIVVNLFSLLLTALMVFLFFVLVYWLLGFFEKEDVELFKRFLMVIKGKLGFLA